MKIFYDKEADAAYIQLSEEQPEGVIEIEEGVNLDMTADNKIAGIEFLDALKKFSIHELAVQDAVLRTLKC